MGEDPIGFSSGDFNWYRYVLSDPVNLVDPNGKNYVLAIISVGTVAYYIWVWYDDVCEADKKREEDDNKCDKIKSLVGKTICYDKARKKRLESWDENSRNIGKNLQKNISGIGIKY